MASRSAPRFYIRIKAPGATNFAPLPAAARVTAFKFEDDETKTDKLTLSVDNYDLSALEGDLWVPENIIEFQFGYPGAMSPPREAIIQRITGFNPLQVEADSKDCLMNRIQRTDKSWEKVKRSDVVREIVNGYGYDEDAKLHIVDTKVVIPHITQGRMTDLQFIKSLAAREGFEFFVDFDGVHFHRRSTKDKPHRTLTYFTDPGQGDITGVSLEIDKRGKQAASAIVLTGKDTKTGETIKVRADAATTANEHVGLSDNNTASGTEASQIEAVNEVTGQTFLTTSAEAKVAAQELSAPTTETTKAAAQRLADGLYNKHSLRGATLTLTLVLDALTIAKAVIHVLGIGTKLSGNWYVKNAAHDVIAGTTTVKLAREGLNGQGARSLAAKVNKDQGAGAAAGVGDGAGKLEPKDSIDAFGNETTDFVPAPRGDGT